MQLRSLPAAVAMRGLAAVLALGAGCTNAKPAAPAAESAAPRPVAVSVAAAVRRDVPVFLDGLGSVVAWKTVTVRAQVDGRLDKVLFKEGQQVRRGEVLAQIDPRPFLAQLHQAEGALARDTALLRNNRLNLERYVNLRKQDLIAQQQADDQQAAVDQYAGAVGVAQAQIETAKLQLGYAQITSPIDGVTGVRLIDEGNIIHASDPGGLVVVTQLDPIAVLFTLPEDDLPRILARQKEGAIRVEAYSREGDQLLGTGELVVIDNQINQSTATVRIKAAFANPARKLWPNQFIKARLLLAVRKDAIVIPAVAVQRGPKGTFVYTVSAEQTAIPQPVQLAEISGSLAIITQGLTEATTVIVEGQNQLRPGAPVSVAKAGGGRGAGERASGEQASGERASGEHAAGERASGEHAAGERASGEHAPGEHRESGSKEPSGAQAPRDPGPAGARPPTRSPDPASRPAGAAGAGQP